MALQMESENINALEQLGNYYVNKEEWEEAKTTVDKIYKVITGDEDMNYKVEQMMSVGRLMMEVDSWDQCIEIMQLVEQLDGANAEALYLQALCLFNQKIYRESNLVIQDIINNSNLQSQLQLDPPLSQAIHSLQKDLH